MTAPSHAPPSDVCPFCRNIASGGSEHPLEVLYRDDDVWVKLNPWWRPRNPGSALVIPIAHHENVYDLPDVLGTPIQRAIRMTALAQKAAYGCEGTSTRQHNEPAGGQDVWHLHVHVFPRWTGDRLDTTGTVLGSAADARHHADLLRAHWPPA